MKKIFLRAILFCLLLVLLIPISSKAAIVTCNGPDCTIQSFLAMLYKIYDFLVKQIAMPLAVMALTAGGIIILVSAGNPGLASKGKQIVWISIIGLALVFGSWAIIQTILGALHYKGL
jgi:hypothetical protein